MPNDIETRQLVATESERLQADPNRPYKIRKKKEGKKDSRGQVVGTQQYDYRTISNIRTQPLKETELDRIPEGLREKSWRFAMVIPKNIGELPKNKEEMLDFGEELEYKGHWYKVRYINDWDLIQGCKLIFVE